MNGIMLAGLLMGIAGSFHCVGMCGPLALSLPLPETTTNAKLSGTILYNLGRMFTYTILGVLVGLIGESAAFFGFQQWLSIVMGVSLLLFILLPKYFPQQAKRNNSIDRLFEKIRNQLGLLFSRRSYQSLFFIGLLNGLLPCGLVYMALAAAVASGSVVSSGLFMAGFGAGTIPVMWSLSFFGNYIGMPIRAKIRKAYPYMMSLVACLLIIRGLGLGIPYVSPVTTHTQKKTIIECCHKP